MPDAVPPRGVPVERLRAMVRLLSPDDMTPHAARTMESICEEYGDEVRGVGVPSQEGTHRWWHTTAYDGSRRKHLVVEHVERVVGEYDTHEEAQADLESRRP